MHATKVGNPNMLITVISIPLHSAARWEAWEVFITRPVAWVGGAVREIVRGAKLYYRFLSYVIVGGL